MKRSRGTDLLTPTVEEKIRDGEEETEENGVSDAERDGLGIGRGKLLGFELFAGGRK